MQRKYGYPYEIKQCPKLFGFIFFISRVLRVFPDTISFFRVHDAHDWSWGFAWLNDELLEGKIDIMKPYATRFLPEESLMLNSQFQEII